MQIATTQKLLAPGSGNASRQDISLPALLDVSLMRRAFALLTDCRDLAHDPLLWRLHLYSQLGRLFNATFVVGARLSGCRRGTASVVGENTWWISIHDEVIAYRIPVRALRDNPFSFQLWCDVVRSVRLGDCAVLFQRSPCANIAHAKNTPPAYQTLCAAIATTAQLVSLRVVDGDSDIFDGIILCRNSRTSNFSQSDAAAIDMIHDETVRLMRSTLAGGDEPSASQLPKRIRDVLRLLLDGAADKSIAKTLGLSWHTVNQYTKQIYRHFGVQSRGELLALWLRRSWRTRPLGTEDLHHLPPIQDLAVLADEINHNQR